MATSKTYTATVKGGFWETNGVGSLSPVPNGRGSNRRLAALMFGGSRLQAFRALGEALNGAAPGALASKTMSVVSASTELGGVRKIDQVQVINRPTTAADQQEVDDDVWTMSTRTTFGANPPINGDRNPLGTR